MSCMSSEQLQQDFIPLGHISRPHGVHGAVIISPYNENSDIVIKSSELIIHNPKDGSYKTIVVNKAKAAAQGFIIKFKEVGNRDQAEEIRGFIIGVQRQHLPPLADDEVYLADLLGLDVLLKDGTVVGRVDKFLEIGGGLTLSVQVRENQEKEHLIPFIPNIVLDVDLEKKRILIDPPDGLLEL